MQMQIQQYQISQLEQHYQQQMQQQQQQQMQTTSQEQANAVRQQQVRQQQAQRRSPQGQVRGGTEPGPQLPLQPRKKAPPDRAKTGGATHTTSLGKPYACDYEFENGEACKYVPVPGSNYHCAHITQRA
jgi:hypothetical protein